MKEKLNKTERILFILDNLSHRESFTTSQMMAKFDRANYEVSERKVQRDLEALHKFNKIKLLGREKREKLWMYNEVLQKIPSIYIPENEVLSFHILKAHLQHFKGTVIEESINELFKKLEDVIPGDVFSKESMFWDKNFGKYDYFQVDATIRRSIKYISNNKWIEVDYYNAPKDKTSTFICYPRTMFEYSGSLYLVVYLPKPADDHRVLLIQNIEKIVELKNKAEEKMKKIKVPEFKFDEWAKYRFGVFFGDLVNVKLLIKKDYKRFFENRHWNHSQKFTKQRNGSLLLEMQVPIVPDFVSWIVGWGEGIKVLEPQELIDRVVSTHKAALDVYGT